MSSIFTKILKGEVPGDILLENKMFFVIKDISPLDRTHLLIIPKREIQDLNELKNHKAEKEGLLDIIQQTSQLLTEPEYRIQINCGKKAGQEVMHLHVHMISPFDLK